MLVPLDRTVGNTGIHRQVFFLELENNYSKKEWEHTSRFAPFDIDGSFVPEKK